MPSVLHETHVNLFRECPELIPCLLRDALAITVPAHRAIRIDDSTFNQIVPTAYQADLVVNLVQDQGPVMGLVVEVQLSKDPRKHFTWPLYVAALHARLQCTTCLLVVAPDHDIAAWASQPIYTLQPRSPFCPLVLGPDQVPIVTSIEQAQAMPELAVLSSLAHGRRDAIGARVGRVALQAIGCLDDKRGELYTDMVLSSLSQAVRMALEAEMAFDFENYEFQSEPFKRVAARLAQKAAEQAANEATAQAQKAAEQAAKEATAQAQKAAEQAAKEGAAQAQKAAEQAAREASKQALTKGLLAVFATRNFPLTDEARERIHSCADTETLERWLERAVSATSVNDVLKP